MTDTLAAPAALISTRTSPPLTMSARVESVTIVSGSAAAIGRAPALQMKAMAQRNVETANALSNRMVILSRQASRPALHQDELHSCDRRRGEPVLHAARTDGDRRLGRRECVGMLEAVVRAQIGRGQHARAPFANRRAAHGDRALPRLGGVRVDDGDGERLVA